MSWWPAEWMIRRTNARRTSIGSHGDWFTSCCKHYSSPFGNRAATELQPPSWTPARRRQRRREDSPANQRLLVRVHLSGPGVRNRDPRCVWSDQKARWPALSVVRRRPSGGLRPGRSATLIELAPAEGTNSINVARKDADPRAHPTPRAPPQTREDGTRTTPQKPNGARSSGLVLRTGQSPRSDRDGPGVRGE
jgi:hypothetical protein